MSYSVTRLLKFDAAHRVLKHESKCAHLHGHEYRVEVTATSLSLDDVGRVVDFSVIKEIVGGWIDNMFDHGTIVNRDDLSLRSWLEENDQKHFVMCEPTAENIAQIIKMRAGDMMLQYGVRITKVRLWETQNCFAEV